MHANLSQSIAELHLIRYSMLLKLSTALTIVNYSVNCLNVIYCPSTHVFLLRRPQRGEVL